MLHVTTSVLLAFLYLVLFLMLPATNITHKDNTHTHCLHYFAFNWTCFFFFLLYCMQLHIFFLFLKLGHAALKKNGQNFFFILELLSVHSRL